jgi:hypothetical protein
MRIANGAARTSCDSKAAAAAKATIVLVAMRADVVHVAGSRTLDRSGGDLGHRDNVCGHALMGLTLYDAMVRAATRWYRRREPSIW